MSNAFIFEEAFNLLLGKLVGAGMSRKVFACTLRDDVVIKVEEGEALSHFQNHLEWLTWQHVSGSPEAKWFAPCHDISANGRVLVMARTEPVSRSRLPTRIPRFLSDMKPANFGLYKGRVVCHDYGTNLLFRYGQTKATQKADWI